MKRTKNATYTIALVAIMAASIECAKLALAAIPNVEAVTLLIALYSYTFGAPAAIATLVFVIIEPLIWGVGPWIISYFIYWPTLAVVFTFLGKIGIKRRPILTLTACILTVLFGFISSAVDVGLFSGYFDNFLYRFFVYYARGIGFYITQIVTNLFLFTFLFLPLHSVLLKIKK